MSISITFSSITGPSTVVSAGIPLRKGELITYTITGTLESNVILYIDKSEIDGCWEPTQSFTGAVDTTGLLTPERLTQYRFRCEVPNGSSQTGAVACEMTNYEQMGWNDVNIDVGQLRSGATQPGLINFNSTGIYLTSFDVNEEISGAFEMPHGWRRESIILPHFHFFPTTDPAGTKYVKFQLVYAFVAENQTPSPVTIATEVKVGAVNKRQSVALPDIVATPSYVGAQVLFTFRRIPAVGTAYAGECAMNTLGFHIQTDELGSLNPIRD